MSKGYERKNPPQQIKRDKYANKNVMPLKNQTLDFTSLLKFLQERYQAYDSAK